MTKVKNYFSLIKFSHTIFAMPFALIGFFLGLDYFLDLSGLFEYSPVLSGNDDKDYSVIFTWQFWMIKFFLVLLCMIFARSAAMAFNRYLDRHFDAKNPRTAIREIPSGVITEKNALVFTIINCVLFIICTFFINQICFFLSPVALFVILFYSYTKRFTALCHMVLGLGLSLAPIGAYLAVTAAFDWLPVLFSFAVLFWVSGFDIIYALQDEEFDKANQLHSIPSILGKTKAIYVSQFLHVLSAVAVIFAGWYGKFGYWYWAGIAVFIGMLIYQHSIVKPNDLRRVNIAFMTANGIASVVFAIFVLLDLFLS
ncbi:MAG TPA: UbiA-like polyprenyltransferase [Ferruginibacter sp.]|nr:UbiA-like polyprenyltransferase [Ferruginibacter sp.]